MTKHTERHTEINKKIHNDIQKDRKEYINTKTITIKYRQKERNTNKTHK